MEDNQIIKLYLERSEKAIEETDKKYRSYCNKISMNILNNHRDSEECINDTYLHTWNVIPPQIPNMFSVFLGRIVRNLSLDCYKRRKAKKRAGDEFAILLSELEECIPAKENVWGKYKERDLTKKVDCFLDAVSNRDRNIFLRRYFYGDSVKTIAASFSVTESNVKIILFRIREKLKIYLEQEGYEL